RLGRGDGGGLHRLRDDEAGGGLRGRGDRPARKEDGPRRRHRLRVEGHGGGQDRSPGEGRLPGRAQSVANRRTHGRGAQRSLSAALWWGSVNLRVVLLVTALGATACSGGAHRDARTAS